MNADGPAKPLLFLASLFVIGAAVRFGGSLGTPAAPDRMAAEQGLVRQLERVEAARREVAGGAARPRRASGGAGTSAPGGGRRRDPAAGVGVPESVAVPMGVPPEVAAAAGWLWRPSMTAVGRPPERPVSGRGRPRVAAGAAAPTTAGAADGTLDTAVDLDIADASLLERLPGIGPSLAMRIVADREANGPFGGLEGLDRVPGIGPAMLGRLAPHVTFSGVARPPRSDTVPPTVRRPPRRRHHG